MAITGLSLVPHLLVPPNDTDKILHVYAYCFLTLIPALALKRQWHVAVLGLLLFLIGIANEVLQMIIGGREASIYDALANGGGVITGLTLSWLIQRGWTADEKSPLTAQTSGETS